MASTRIVHARELGLKHTRREYSVCNGPSGAASGVADMAVDADDEQASLFDCVLLSHRCLSAMDAARSTAWSRARRQPRHGATRGRVLK